MKKTIYATIIVLCLCFLTGEKTPEWSWQAFWLFKSIALILMILSSRRLNQLLK